MNIRNIFLLPLVAIAALVTAQEAPQAELVLPKQVALGKPVQATVKITFDTGWHGYQNPPTKDYMIPVKVESATKGVTVKAAYPKGVIMDFGGESTAVYEGTVSIPVTITLPKKLGASEFKLNVSYQQCNAETCQPPANVVLTGKVTVKAAAPKH
jgi:DsbC/DsbD-like thiol-disulfide interchange protein